MLRSPSLAFQGHDCYSIYISGTDFQSSLIRDNTILTRLLTVVWNDRSFDDRIVQKTRYETLILVNVGKNKSTICNEYINDPQDSGGTCRGVSTQLLVNVHSFIHFQDVFPLFFFFHPLIDNRQNGSRQVFCRQT